MENQRLTDQFSYKSLTNMVTKLSFLTLLVISFSANAQECNADIQESTPTSDFINNNDGTVTHNATGLMWKRCSEGQAWNEGSGSCDGNSASHTWQAALGIPSSLNASSGFAGKTDWRLPNIKELNSMIEFKCYARSLNEDLFPNTATALNAWSSSPSAIDAAQSWSLNFYNGIEASQSRDVNNWVRLVRTAW